MRYLAGRCPACTSSQMSRSPSCSSTTTPRPPRLPPDARRRPRNRVSSARPADGDEAIRLAGELQPRVIVMDARHAAARAGSRRRARILRKRARRGDPDAQHALGGDARAAGDRRRRARLHPQERARPRPGRRRSSGSAAGETVLDPAVDPVRYAQRRAQARADAARARGAAAHLRWAVEPRDRRAARAERQHRRGASREHHERARACTRPPSWSSTRCSTAW